MTERTWESELSKRGRALEKEREQLRAVRAAAQELLALGIINPTGSARVEAATAALAAAVEASN